MEAIDLSRQRALVTGASSGIGAATALALAREVAANRIRVTSVSPGAIKTDINRPAWKTEAAQERLLQLIPCGRIGEPEDVARIVVWLASDFSDYITGATRYVDGGMTLYPAFQYGG